MNPLGFKLIPESCQKVRKASNQALSRAHNINFLKEETKFFESSDKLGGYLNDWSLKAIPQFLKSVKHMGKMASEKLKSIYYLNK